MTKPGGEPTHREELEQRDAELLSEIIGVVSSCRTHDALSAEYDGLLAKVAAHRQAFALSERNAEREKLLAELWTPTEEQWSGLPRAMMMWLDMTDRPTPASLLLHLRRTGCEVPDWLRDEGEMQSPDHVISKGTRAVMIYRAMLPATAIRSNQHAE